jgi:hypothetical protein
MYQQFQSNVPLPVPAETEFYSNNSYNESPTSLPASNSPLPHNFLQSSWNDSSYQQISTPYPYPYPYSYSPISNHQQVYSTTPYSNNSNVDFSYNTQYDTSFYNNSQHYPSYNQYSDESVSNSSNSNSTSLPSSNSTSYSSLLNNFDCSLFDANTSLNQNNYATPAPPQVQIAVNEQPKQQRMPKNASVSRTFQLPDLAVDIMNEWFDDHLNNPYPQLVEKENMAKRGGITVKQVTAWFSNRRNRSQNTKPKRMRRVLEKQMSEICQELVNNPNKDHVIEKFRNTLASHEIGLNFHQNY